jgi:hypothetical protein
MYQCIIPIRESNNGVVTKLLSRTYNNCFPIAYTSNYAGILLQLLFFVKKRLLNYRLSTLNLTDTNLTIRTIAMFGFLNLQALFHFCS